MSYSDIYGNRPPEFASKSSHSQIIKDKNVNDYLAKCQLPNYAEEIDEGNFVNKIEALKHVSDADNPINYILAFDCGYNKSIARKSFPSAEVALIQFGALFLSLKDIEDIESKPFANPKEMAKLKRTQTWNLVLPISGIKYKDKTSLLDSIRITLKEFFDKPLTSTPDSTLLVALKWLIYQEYGDRQEGIQLNACPHPGCQAKNIDLDRNKEAFTCPSCRQELFLIDLFRFHELIDEEQGANGIIIYLISLVEQLLIVHYLRFFTIKSPENLRQILFLRDGPLAFFGQTALFHKHMLQLVNFLQSKYLLHLAGLEKSGSFVDHAIEVCNQPHEKISKGHFFLLNNDYIYKYIIAGKSDHKRPYGSSTNYGSKLIFQDSNGHIHLVSIPVAHNKIVLNPDPSDFKNLVYILNVIEKLKCDMYDNALLPITLVNKAVSLANRPSAIILEKFAKYKIVK
ncbi:MAG: NurA domain-containing protein [Candidatus Saccharibacteria bacterium]|nr:NurA domain-containing protein [Candidatus Saccharibacteria bacterium]